MKILYIEHYAGAPKYGMEIRPYMLAKNWVINNHEVRIVGAKYTHLRSINPQKSEETIGGIKYFWLNTPKYKKNDIKRFWNLLVFLFRLYTKQRIFLRNFNPDVVIASSTYPMDIFPAKRIAKKYGSKLIFELHDLWPLSLYYLGAFTPKNLFAKWVQYAEDTYCKHSEKVISILPNAKDYLVSRGMQKEKFVYIPNGVNMIKEQVLLSEVFSQKIKKIKDQYNFIIGYTGTFNESNNLAFLLKASISNDTAIVLVGDGLEESNLKRIARKYNQKSVYFFERMPQKYILGMLKEFDVLYISSLRRPLYKYGISPIKLCEYMLSEKPIIQAVQSDTNSLVKEAKCGFLVSPDDINQLNKAIVKIKSMPKKERERMGEKGRDFVESNYDYRVLSDKFLEAIL